jgi:hypothetical protein
MMRSPTVAGLAWLLALAQASAQEVSSVARSAPKPHEAKAAGSKPLSSKTASLGDMSLGDIRFSNPYAPPVGAPRVKNVGLPEPERHVPTDPQGGFTIKAGRDSPDAPMTGGLMFRF